MKRRRFYETPSTKATPEKGEAVRRARKQARKKVVRDGLIAARRRKEIEGGSDVEDRPSGSTRSVSCRSPRRRPDRAHMRSLAGR
jgi:small subunit ribosomal protein S21